MRSDMYTIIYALIVTIILGLLLSFTADNLKEKQKLNQDIDIKKNILSSLGYKELDSNPWTNNFVQAIYKKNIRKIYIDDKGNEIQYSDINNRKIFELYINIDNNIVKGYAIPISGKGLWGTMYGYFAIDSDAATVKGITFYKHKETPGLGGEVDKEWFKNNFIGKKLINDMGELVSIEVIKGIVSNNDPNKIHKVDGISGATITCRGITNFLKKDLLNYELYFSKIRNSNSDESI